MEKLKALQSLDTLKEKYQTESLDDTKKRKRWLIFPAVINLILGIAMVAVGAVYQVCYFLISCNLDLNSSSCEN